MNNLSQAEANGLAHFAKEMSLKDLQWQVKNAAKTGVTGAALQIFKDELAERGPHGKDAAWELS